MRGSAASRSDDGASDVGRDGRQTLVAKPQRIGGFFVALGIGVLLSGLLVNPWVGRLYRRQIVDHHDVMLGYFAWAAAVGLLLVAIGWTLRRPRSPWTESAALFVTTCALIALSDRLLLARWGLPLWESDVELHYRHRPGAVRSWHGAHAGKLIRINRYGHHGADFPLEKGAGEFRVLVLGDSIPMGHGVTWEEAFPHRLEELLVARSGGRGSVRVINAGVQGYSTFHEEIVLGRSLVFEPDFVAIGFCMNDLSEPFVVDRRFGGLGLDYHGVSQASSKTTGFLLNETGYGRAIQWLRGLATSAELERKWEAQSIRRIAARPAGDPEFAENWRLVLGSLERMYESARSRGIRIALLIFPHTFQLMDRDLQWPQRILADHASRHGVDAVDFTPVFERILFGSDSAGTSAASPAGLRAQHRAEIRTYFLDRDHYTVEGHRRVAAELDAHLSRRYSFEQRRWLAGD
jgi:hypothetical protein